MKAVILDTDILSEYFRGNIRVAERIEEYLLQYDVVSFSIITYYEMLNGLLYRDAKKQLKRFEEFAGLNNVIPLTLQSVKISAEIQAELRTKGIEIGHTDTLIAGVAVSNELKLITNNTNHFKRVKNLEIGNWLK